MDELISKGAVIEAIEKARANVGHNLERSIGKSIIEILDDVGRDVDRLPPALGTNLAEVGTDCINRQAAIDELDKGAWGVEWDKALAKAMIESLPPAHPEIVRCKDCKYAEYIDDVKTLWCTECGQGRTVAPNDFCSYAERRTDGRFNQQTGGD